MNQENEEEKSEHEKKEEIKQNDYVFIKEGKYKGHYGKVLVIKDDGI
jgi:transcription antitermination factor NusG